MRPSRSASAPPSRPRRRRPHRRLPPDGVLSPCSSLHSLLPGRTARPLQSGSERLAPSPGTAPGARRFRPRKPRNRRNCTRRRRASHMPQTMSSIRALKGQRLDSFRRLGEGPPVATRLGVDVGGTFTDLIFYDDETGEIRVGKETTPPAAPEDGVLAAVDAGVPAGRLGSARYFLHGTTVGLNSLLT